MPRKQNKGKIKKTTSQQVEKNKKGSEKNSLTSYNKDNNVIICLNSKSSLKQPTSIFITSIVTFITGIIISSVYYQTQVGQKYENAIDNQLLRNNIDSNTSSNCGLYVAKSTIENAGLGIFTANPINRGEIIGNGDIVIQIPDANPYFLSSMKVLTYDYLWEGQETGGQYEGQRVSSVVAGIGMLANGHATDFNAVQPLEATVDSGELHRHTHYGAGAISHYWNYTFYASKDIAAGGEVFVNYGSNWFMERKEKSVFDNLDHIEYAIPNPSRSLEYLKTNGICLDNIKVGPSTNPQAGRGAFATRHIRKGDIVAPAPVVQITDRRSLELLKVKTFGSDDEKEESVERTFQLLLNYCYGHQNSSVLLLPFAPVVNFINHDFVGSNVELRWSNSTQHDLRYPHEISIEQLEHLKHAGLMLEYIATQDIQEGEEIFLNYGKKWEDAWNKHVNEWKPDYSGVYEYANKLNIETDVIKTMKEQSISPYPENLFTSCYFYYRKSEEQTAKWVMNNTTLSSSNLRPCHILDRHENVDGVVTYTVAILNRYGLHENQRIPQGRSFIVTGVPRGGIRFTSKLYTSDQHSATAFRHEIGIPDEIFPRNWMDL